MYFCVALYQYPCVLSYSIVDCIISTCLFCTCTMCILLFFRSSSSVVDSELYPYISDNSVCPMLYVIAGTFECHDFATIPGTGTSKLSFRSLLVHGSITHTYTKQGHSPQIEWQQHSEPLAGHRTREQWHRARIMSYVLIMS